MCALISRLFYAWEIHKIDKTRLEKVLDIGRKRRRESGEYEGYRRENGTHHSSLSQREPESPDGEPRFVDRKRKIYFWIRFRVPLGIKVWDRGPRVHGPFRLILSWKIRPSEINSEISYSYDCASESSAVMIGFSFFNGFRRKPTYSRPSSTI